MPGGGGGKGREGRGSGRLEKVLSILPLAAFWDPNKAGFVFLWGLKYSVTYRLRDRVLWCRRALQARRAASPGPSAWKQCQSCCIQLQSPLATCPPGAWTECHPCFLLGWSSLSATKKLLRQIKWYCGGRWLSGDRQWNTLASSVSRSLRFLAKLSSPKKELPPIQLKSVEKVNATRDVSGSPDRNTPGSLDSNQVTTKLETLSGNDLKINQFNFIRYYQGVRTWLICVSFQFTPRQVQFPCSLRSYGGLTPTAARNQANQ